MPLAHYGVVIGAFDHFGPPQQGRWYHGEIYLVAPPGLYQCAVDVATKSTIRVQYRVLHCLDHALFAPLLGLAAGYHDLAPSPASGAPTRAFAVRVVIPFAVGPPELGGAGGLAPPQPGARCMQRHQPSEQKSAPYRPRTDGLPPGASPR
jgi:hypothetical protein